MITAKQLFDEAFNKPRDPQSPACKEGVRAALKRSFEFILKPDAYLSGYEEAYSIGVDWEWKMKEAAACNES